MRILHLVELYYPSIGGAQECVRQISERLVQNGHEVTVVTSHLPKSSANAVMNGVHIKRFKISGNLVKGIEGDVEAFKDFALSTKFDIVMCYATQQWTFDLFNEIINQISAKKVLVPCGFSGLHNSSYRDYFHQMPDWLSKYDRLVNLSETYQDAVFLKAHNLTNTVLIPNCADETEFLNLPSETDKSKVKKSYGLNKKVITTIGGFTGMKGQLEAISVFKRLPIKDSSLVIIGNNDFDQKYFEACKIFAKSVNESQRKLNKNVVILETNKDINRSQTLDILKSSDLFLFLSYIEASPLVIFESIAAGIPFVSSDVGNVSEIVEWTKAGKIVRGKRDRAGIFHANKLDALLKSLLILNSPRIHKRMSVHGRKAFHSKFNWASCAKMYEATYKDLVET